MLLSAEHKGILSILSGKKHGLVSFLTPWSSMAMGLPGLAILWVCPLLWRGRCLNWRVQAALLLGHLEQKLFLNIAQKRIQIWAFYSKHIYLMRTVTVGWASWSFPRGSSKIPRMTLWSMTKYLKAWTASDFDMSAWSLLQELHCITRDFSSRRVDKLSAPHELGK